MTQTDQPTLPDYEGLTVTGSRIKIVNVGDGLSDALKVDPVALSLGDETFHVVRGDVVDVAHHRDKNGVVWRVHTIKGSTAAPIDMDTARKAIQTYAEETERIRAEQAGQLALGAEQAAEAREAND
jgi:hypothetical protein